MVNLYWTTWWFSKRLGYVWIWLWPSIAWKILEMTRQIQLCCREGVKHLGIICSNLLVDIGGTKSAWSIWVNNYWKNNRFIDGCSVIFIDVHSFPALKKAELSRNFMDFPRFFAMFCQPLRWKIHGFARRSRGGVRADGIDNEVHRSPCEAVDAEDWSYSYCVLSFFSINSY